MNLSRESLIRRLREIELWPELVGDLNRYLHHYVLVKDIELIQLLLSVNAEPDSQCSHDCYLHHLLQEYKKEKYSEESLSINIMKALLEAGADPNRVWGNNYRAYDCALEENIQLVVETLELYGADKKPRKFI